MLIVINIKPVFFITKKFEINIKNNLDYKTLCDLKLTHIYYLLK